MLTAAIYLHTNSDPQVRQAMYHMEQMADTNPNGLVSHAMRISEKYSLNNLLPTYEGYKSHINHTKTMNLVRNKQRQGLREEREGKV